MLPPRQMTFPSWGKCLPSLASPFSHSPLCKSQNLSSLSTHKVPEQHTPCERAEGPAKDCVPTSHCLRCWKFPAPLHEPPIPPHHPGLAPNGMRTPINPLCTQTMGTASCVLGTADGMMNYSLQTRARRQPVSLGFAFLEHRMMLVFTQPFFFCDLPNRFNQI